MSVCCSVLVILIFLFIIKFSILLPDYCSICSNRTHTICKHKEGPADNCLEYKTINFTSEFKRYICDLHNDIRRYVASGSEEKGGQNGQPPAADMLLLEWDDELAYIAQRWADQCIQLNSEPQHDECRKTVSNMEVGQNVLTAVTSHEQFPNLNLLILKWYFQVFSVVPSDIHYFSLSKGKNLIGHYTQLVWAKTHYVGCAVASYKNIKSLVNETYYLHRLVCNYAPSGNIVGAPVYEIGNPCSKCPRGFKCDSDNLLCVHIPLKPKNATFVNNYLVTYKLQMHDILSMDRIVPELFKLEDGEILIDDEEIFGLEDDNKNSYDDGLEIMLREMEINKDEYILEKGIWYDGACRCHLVYRSSASIFFNQKLVYAFVLFILVSSAYY